MDRRLPPGEPDVIPTRNTAWYWYFGMVIDVVHMPVVLGVVVLGAAWLPQSVYLGLVSAIAIMQVALLGCPVLAATRWLKRKHDPSYRGGWSVTVWLYHRYGRFVGVGVFVLLLAAGVVARVVLV